MRVERILALRRVLAGTILAAAAGIGAGTGARGAGPGLPARNGGGAGAPGKDGPATSKKPILASAPDELNPAELSDQDVLDSLKSGSDFLLTKLATDIETLKKQVAEIRNKGRGAMYFNNDQLAGEISMSVYALLTVGQVTGDPRLRFSSKEMAEPIKIEEELRTQYTYAVAFHVSALAMLPKRPEIRKLMDGDLEELLRGTVNGVYTYYTRSPTGQAGFGDHSNTQYGELGVWTCEDQGLEVPTSYWEAVDQHWRSHQLASGAWVYMTQNFPPGRGPMMMQGTPTMTCAGVASLFLAKDELDYSVHYNPAPDAAIEAGLHWLTAQYPKYIKTLATNLYLAYALERVALYGGVRTFGTHDWYREGAAVIIGAQKQNGSFGFAMSDTAYGLLFLSRGLAPVGMAKLQYKGPWDARSRDCARFIHWFAKESERPLNWQVVSIDSDAATWGNIPVLVITGHDDPKFTPEQLAKLRQYVENGGLIFSSADDGSAAFTKAIREKYAPAMFGNQYEMRALPADHPAFTLSYKVPKAKRPTLFGLSNGVREVWIHSTEDVTGSWQSYSLAQTRNFYVPANLYYYTLGHTQAGIHYPPLTPPEPPPAKVTLSVARVMYAGNWDPEPAAWGRFAEAARQDHAAIIHVIPTKIADLDPAKTPVAVMTGTAAFTLSDQERGKLADYLAKGGKLLADAAGGSDAFAASFTAMMGRIFPQAPMFDLGTDSPVLTGNFAGGAVLDDLARRPYSEMPDERTKSLVPLAMMQGGKAVVIFSPGDLTGGILGLRTWGIRGYMPEVAADLTWNALAVLGTKLQPKPAAVAASAPAGAATAPATNPAAPATGPALPPAPPVEPSQQPGPGK